MGLFMHKFQVRKAEGEINKISKLFDLNHTMRLSPP